MVSAGDRIRLSPNKGPAREGIVTGVTGSMLRVRWGSGDETTVIPGPGTLTVLGRSARKTSRPAKAMTATAKASGTKAAPAKRATAKRAAGGKVAKEKTSAQRTAKKSTASDTIPSKRPRRGKGGGPDQQTRG